MKRKRRRVKRLKLDPVKELLATMTRERRDEVEALRAEVNFLRMENAEHARRWHDTWVLGAGAAKLIDEVAGDIRDRGPAVIRRKRR